MALDSFISLDGLSMIIPSTYEITELDMREYPKIQSLYCSYNKLRTLICNEDLVILDCHCNELIQIILTKNIKIVWCFDNKLSSFICNDSIEELYCWNNKLTSFVSGKSLRILNCSINKITTFVCGESLKELEINYNDLTYLKCNESLLNLSCSYNKLKTLICNYGLQYLICINNPLEILKCFNHLGNEQISVITITPLLLSNIFSRISLLIMDNNEEIIDYYEQNPDVRVKDEQLIKNFDKPYDHKTDYKMIVCHN